MADTKEKLIRVLQILQETDDKSPVNAGQIIEKLERGYGITGVDRHSVYQDIALLVRCGYKIEQCRDRRKGWYLSKRFLEDWEIGILMDSVMQTKCLTYNDAKSLKARLMNLCSERGRKRFRNLFSAMPALKVPAGEPVGAYIESMLEAMYMGKKVEFRYTELDEYLKPKLRRNGALYELSLYGIYWGGTTYYLIGMHDHHDDLTHYRLDRIRDLVISEKNAIPAEQRIGKNATEKIRRVIERQVKHFSGEEICVEVEYEPGQVQNAILYDFTDGRVHICPQLNGKMRASFRKMSSVTLLGWLIQYSSMYEVISPAELRAEVKKSLQTGLETYSRLREGLTVPDVETE